MATSIVETITPAKAQEYLNLSGLNRNLSKGVIESYATSMKQGKWLLNGEPIVFDVAGEMINGQHRLHACIKAGVPFQTFVVRGVENESFTTFDCGRHRTVSQLIGMQGIRNYNSVASCVQFVYKLDNGMSVGESDSVTKRYRKSNTELIEKFNSDREGFIEAGEFAQKMSNNARVLDKSLIGGVYYYLSRRLGWNVNTVKHFFEQICTLDTCPNFTLNQFRKRMIKSRDSKVEKLTRSMAYALLVKAWNCFITGKTVKCLKYSPDTEDHPKFIHP